MQRGHHHWLVARFQNGERISLLRQPLVGFGGCFEHILGARLALDGCQGHYAPLCRVVQQIDKMPSELFGILIGEIQPGHVNGEPCGCCGELPAL